MNQEQVYILDLTIISGKGDFLCPRCGTRISPDDTTEEIYSVLEARVNSHCLEELLICCNRCESEIHLTGFDTIQKLLEAKEQNSYVQKELSHSRLLGNTIPQQISGYLHGGSPKNCQH